MFLSDKRTSFYLERRRRSRIKKIIPIFLFLVLAALGAYFFTKNKESVRGVVNKSSKREIILELWENQKYLDLINYCDSLLEEDPASVDALIFRGFASFYEGASRVNFEDKIPFIDDSVSFLRKAIIFDNNRLSPQVDYVLGRAYYHKGKYYADLSIKYLEKSIDEQYIRRDSYEYLALAYAELGNNEKSVHFFEIAAENNPSDILFSLLAQIYIDLDSYDLAEEYLLQSNDKTNNLQIEEKNLFLLGQIYESKSNMAEAQECYLRIIQINSGSADAYYRLGLLYEMAGDNIKARAEWRRALRADPQHYGARLKLF